MLVKLVVVDGLTLNTVKKVVSIIYKETRRNQMKDEIVRYCKKCKKKTVHLLCGFGIPGGMSGNARYECKECRLKDEGE